MRASVSNTLAAVATAFVGVLSVVAIGHEGAMTAQANAYCDGLRADVDAKYQQYLSAQNEEERRRFSNDWDSARRYLAGAIAGGNCNSIGVNERGDTPPPTPLDGPRAQKPPTAQYCDDLRNAADKKYVEYLEAPGHLQPGLSAEWDSLRRDLYSAIAVGHCNTLGVDEPGPPAPQGPLPQYGKCEFEKQTLDNAAESLATAQSGNPGSVEGNRNVMMQNLNLQRAQAAYEQCIGTPDCAKLELQLEIALMDYQTRARNASAQELFQLEDDITLLSTAVHECNGRLSECDDEYVDLIRVQKAAANRPTTSREEALAQLDLIGTAKQKYDACVAIHGTGVPGSTLGSSEGCDTEECRQWRSHELCMSGLRIRFRNALDDYEVPDLSELSEDQRATFALCQDDFMREAQQRAEGGRPSLQRPQESADTGHWDGCEDEEKELQIAFDLHYYGIWPEGETEVTTNPWQRYTIAFDEEAKCRTAMAAGGFPGAGNGQDPCAALNDAVKTMELRFGTRASGNLAFESAKEKAAECNAQHNSATGLSAGTGGSELCDDLAGYQKLFAGAQRSRFQNSLEQCQNTAAQRVSVEGPATPAESTREKCDAMATSLRKQLQDMGIDITPFTIWTAPPGYTEAEREITNCYVAAESGGRTQDDPEIVAHCQTLLRTEMFPGDCNHDFYNRFCTRGQTLPTPTPEKCDHFPDGKPVGSPKEITVEGPASPQESTREQCDAILESVLRQLQEMGIDRYARLGTDLAGVPGYSRSMTTVSECYIAAESGGRTQDDPEIAAHCQTLLRTEMFPGDCNHDFYNRFCTPGQTLPTPTPEKCDHFPEGRAVGSPPEVSVEGPATPAQSTREKCDAMQESLFKQLHDMGIDKNARNGIDLPNVPGYGRAIQKIQTCYVAVDSGGRSLNDAEIVAHCKALTRMETHVDECNDDFFNRFCAHSYEYGFNWGGYYDHTPAPEKCEHFPEGKPVGSPREVSVEGPATLAESTYEKCDAMQTSLFQQLEEMGIDKNERFGIDLPKVPGYGKALQKIQTCYVAAASGGRTLDDADIVKRCKELKEAYLPSNACLEDFFYRFCAYSPADGFGWHGYYLWYPEPDECDHFPEGGGPIGGPANGKPVDPAAPPRNRLQPGMNNPQNGQPAEGQGGPRGNQPNAPQGQGNNPGQRPGGQNNPRQNPPQGGQANNQGPRPQQGNQGGNVPPPPPAPPAAAPGNGLQPLAPPAGAPAQVDMQVAPPLPPPPPIINPVDLQTPVINTWNMGPMQDARQ